MKSSHDESGGIKRKINVIERELLKIAKGNGGRLRAIDVVNAARPKKSPLHVYIWRDGETEAASKWRLHLASRLIRVTVEIIGYEGDSYKVRAFCSLSSDRLSGDGYRIMVDVLSDDQHRDQLLNDALNELACFKKKYAHLRELVQVFQAIDDLEK
jgi:hypothetical protein